jgi:hypothetical protein
MKNSLYVDFIRMLPVYLFNKSHLDFACFFFNLESFLLVLISLELLTFYRLKTVGCTPVVYYDI